MSTKMIPIEELTISQVHSAFKNGAYASKELLEAFLARIAAIDKAGPKLNSLNAISTSALDEASTLDTHFASTSKFIGPLHGIPVIVKDQVETKGIATTYGSMITKNHVTGRDATVVKKLKEVGAIVLAKSMMPDWATGWFSTSSLSGFTKNPFDLSRDPGGSSSGTGTSISANFAILGLGEDTGGSIRLPSSFCGLVGLRPTPGLISRSGLCPLIKTTDTPGPMTRTVRDAALMLDVLVGFDEADPWTSTAVINGPPAGGSYASNLDTNKDLISRSRVGVVGAMFGEDSDPDCKAVKTVIEKAFKKLSESGTTFIDIEIPNMAETLTFTQTYTSRSHSDIDSYLATTKINITCSQIHAQKAYHPNLDLSASICTSPSTPSEDPHYLQRLEDREEFVMTVVHLMAKNNVTALVFPTAKIPAPLHSEVERWDPWGFPTNTLLASALRFPAISVPVGFTKEEEGGLPVGMEIVGLPGREQMLLEMAYGVEGLIGARKAPKFEV